MEIGLAVSTKYEFSSCYLQAHHGTEHSLFSKSPVEMSVNIHQRICTKILLKDKLTI